MAKKPAAGDIDRRAAFQGRAMTSDGFGNHVSGDWTARFTRWCGVQYLRGTEAVMAARLDGKQPVILTVRNDPETRGITPDMRVMIDGQAFNIKEYPRPSNNRGFLEVLAEGGGVAHG